MVYAYQPTGSWQFKKPPQFIAEDSEATPPADPVFKLIGNVIDLNPQMMIGKSIDDGLGARDILSQTGLTEKYTAAFRYKPQTQLDFTKYAINLPNDGTPAGTNAESLTVAWSQLVNGAEKFYALVGLKSDKGTIEISKDGGVVIGQDTKAIDMVFEEDDLSSIGITTPTWVDSVPTTPTMTARSGGLTPMLVDGSARETNRFKIDVNQNVQELDLNGPAKVEHLGAARRRNAIDFDTPYRGKTFYDAYKNQTQLDLEYTIYDAISPPIKLTMTDVQVDQWRRNIQGTSNAFEFEAVVATPITVSLTG